MRDIPVGNGSLLVTFDDKYQIRDLYYPHVGQENHSDGFPFRFGVWVDGVFSWIYEDEWERSLKYLRDTLVTDVRLINRQLEIEIECNDFVVGRENVYFRKIAIRNLRDTERDLRVFLHHDFRIYENKIGDTAYYDPDTLALIHYKRHRYFLINTLPHFDEVATGRKAFRTSEGTWRDAEDGELHGGTITEGSVDSTIGIGDRIDTHGQFEFFYWIAAGTSHHEVSRLNQVVLETTPSVLLDKTLERGRNWLAKRDVDFADLSPQTVDLYRRSLLIVTTQIDNGGAIIAANDHDVTERATDHYSYLWPRDGAFVANALDLAGYHEHSQAFFALCQKIVHERGYFLQKYNPDGSVGSGWHAHWDKWGRKPLYPIQEDETALVLWALWEHQKLTGETDFSRGVYEQLVLKCADFLVDFRDESGLPKSSWNLWEDRRGVHTFTCATVVAGLRGAANFARLFDDADRAGKYDLAATAVVAAMRQRLYSRQLGRFLRSLAANGDDSLHPDQTVDASLFGIFYFGCFDIDDEVVTGTMNAIETHLRDRRGLGGVARFENDGYMRVSDDVTGNAWFICTLWLAEYYVAKAKSVDELRPAREILEWVTKYALPSGVLAEQLDPLTGGPASVSPLTWSHSTFVATVQSYLKRLRELS
jgi:glucoamylase